MKFIQVRDAVHEEYGAPVTIGSDVWVGSGAIILPGVTIGSRTVVGAGSVVSRSLPDNVLAVGNPYGVVRRIYENSANPD